MHQAEKRPTSVLAADMKDSTNEVDKPQTADDFLNELRTFKIELSDDIPFNQAAAQRLVEYLQQHLEFKPMRENVAKNIELPPAMLKKLISSLEAGPGELLPMDGYSMLLTLFLLKHKMDWDKARDKLLLATEGLHCTLAAFCRVIDNGTTYYFAGLTLNVSDAAREATLKERKRCWGTIFPSLKTMVNGCWDACLLLQEKGDRTGLERSGVWPNNGQWNCAEIPIYCLLLALLELQPVIDMKVDFWAVKKAKGENTPQCGTDVMRCLYLKLGGVAVEDQTSERLSLEERMDKAMDVLGEEKVQKLKKLHPQEQEKCG